MYILLGLWGWATAALLVWLDRSCFNKDDAEDGEPLQGRFPLRATIYAGAALPLFVARSLVVPAVFLFCTAGVFFLSWKKGPTFFQLPGP